MNRSQEKVLVASLCGLIVAAAAGFVVQPAMATDRVEMTFGLSAKPMMSAVELPAKLPVKQI